VRIRYNSPIGAIYRDRSDLRYIYPEIERYVAFCNTNICIFVTSQREMLCVSFGALHCPHDLFHGDWRWPFPHSIKVCGQEDLVTNASNRKGDVASLVRPAFASISSSQIIPFSVCACFLIMPSQIYHEESTSHMAIAVVGMSCRFSGIATSTEGLWQMLSKGLTGWSNTAGERFNIDSFWHPKADLNGSVSITIPLFKPTRL
jgi:hypothetical protein